MKRTEEQLKEYEDSLKGCQKLYRYGFGKGS